MTPLSIWRKRKETEDEKTDGGAWMRGDGRAVGMLCRKEEREIHRHYRRRRRSDGDMDDNETTVEQGLSAGEMMRRLGTEDYYAKGEAS